MLNKIPENKEFTDAIAKNAIAFTSILHSATLILDALHVKNANTAFLTLFKTTEEDTIGKKVYELNKGRWNIPALKKLLEEILPSEQQVLNYEVTHSFNGAGNKKLFINGLLINKSTIILSIESREQKSAAYEITEREKIFYEVANNIPVMIWVSDPTRQCNFFNTAWLEFTGKTIEEEKGMGWSKGIHQNDLDYCLQTYNEAFDKRVPFSMEYRLKKHDGEYYWVMDVGKPIYLSTGEFKGYMGTCTNINSQRLINNELEVRVTQRTQDLMEANENLERSNGELQQFAYVASHDLQEPLRKIITYSDRLLNLYKTRMPEDAAQYLDKIIACVERMTTLIDDLLNFSKVTRLSDQFEEVNLNIILQKVLKDFDLAAKNATVNYSTLPTLRAIPVQMTQLFFNLIGNALKFTVPERAAEISISSRTLSNEEAGKFQQLKKDTTYCEIIVKDNGIGFAPEFAEQIFIIFQRLNERHTYPGTGIGLALCKKIALYHQGTIFAKAEEDKGAEFHIILPL